MNIKISNTWVAWMSGWLMHIAFRSLQQDYMGKSGYLEYAESHWTSSSTSDPVAIVLAFIGIGMYFRARDKETAMETPDVQL